MQSIMGPNIFFGKTEGQSVLSVKKVKTSRKFKSFNVKIRSVKT